MSYLRSELTNAKYILVVDDSDPANPIPKLQLVQNSVSPVPTANRGLTPDQIIEMADAHTKRIAEGRLDLKQELVMAAQEFIKEHNWHWKRRSFTFNTEIGERQYFFYDIPDMADLQVTRITPRTGVKIVNGPGDFSCLTAVTDPGVQDELIEDDTYGKPAGYWCDMGQQCIYFDAPADAVYKVRVNAWVTLPADFIDLQHVPLIPGDLHRILVKQLEARIFRYQIGAGSAEYVAAVKELEADTDHAVDQVDFTDAPPRTWTTPASNGDAIQST